MRLFVSYGFNDRDRWVEELVFPLLRATGCDVVHGKTEYGNGLAHSIRDTILDCDALIGFATRRELVGNRWSTHRWVIEELATAFGRLPVIEVRENGVDPQPGMLIGHHLISYEETHRDRCLVDIAQVAARLRENAA